MNQPDVEIDEALAAFARNAPRAGRYSQCELAQLTGLTRATTRKWLWRYTAADKKTLFSFEDLSVLHVVAGLQRAYRPSETALTAALASLDCQQPLLCLEAIQAVATTLAFQASAPGAALFKAWLDRVTWSGPETPTRLYPLYRATTENVADVVQTPRLIAVDPQVRFGAPFLVNSGIPTTALVGFFRGGDSVATIAEEYGIPMTDVEEAIRYALERVR